MSNEYTTYSALKPLSSDDIARLVQEGKADQIVSKMKAYEAQQLAIREKTLALARMTVKLNKSDGLYIAHPSMTMKGGCNFNKHMIPAVVAIATNDHLRGLIADWVREGKTIDTSVILNNVIDTNIIIEE